MRYRQLGRSGLRVSELTVGTIGFGGSGRFAAKARFPTGPRPNGDGLYLD